MCTFWRNFYFLILSLIKYCVCFEIREFYVGPACLLPSGGSRRVSQLATLRAPSRLIVPSTRRSLSCSWDSKPFAQPNPTSTHTFHAKAPSTVCTTNRLSPLHHLPSFSPATALESLRSPSLFLSWMMFHLLLLPLLLSFVGSAVRKLMQNVCLKAKKVHSRD